MRLVLDTNVTIAGLLWAGPPSRLLDLAIDAAVTLYTSPALIDELTQTLRYPKFAKRIEQFGTTPSALAVRYSTLVTLISPTQVPRVIENDPDDDQVLACAIASQADLIVSGDKHLLGLGASSQGIVVVTPAQAVQRIARWTKGRVSGPALFSSYPPAKADGVIHPIDAFLSRAAG